MALARHWPGRGLKGGAKVVAIDGYCAHLQQAFGAATPFMFSGPDPWTEMDEVPAAMPAEALAYVYAAGGEIRWVFLRIVDEEQGWSEDVNYFYDQHGDLVKRVRTVQSGAANISMEMSNYYENGRAFKEVTHHHAMVHGRQDSSQFTDPDAPVFWTTDDLPFGDIMDLWSRLG